MVTYLYWLLVATLVFGALFAFGVRAGKWKPAIIIATIVWIAGTLLYYFWLEQVFVKRFGGRMAIDIPAGQYHMHSTWKEDNLWIENYDPVTNECIFSEYSRGNVLEGRVVLKNCNPINLQQPPALPPGKVMTVEELIALVATDADSLMFADVIATIEQHYQYTPTRFVNGLGTDAVINEAGSNEGSCKVFAFASLHDLNKHDTLNLFAEHFRKVLATPAEKDHANIRMFMRDGWPGIEFDDDALS